MNKKYIYVKDFYKVNLAVKINNQNQLILKHIYLDTEIMPEIRPQPQDIILEKLQQLKCCQNCQNIANYLIFGYGLYCTKCLSQVKDLNPESIVNFSGLSKILVQLIQQYNKNTKSEVSFGKVAKTQTDKGTAQIIKLRKNLDFEISSLKSKCNSLLNLGYKRCLEEHRLQQLQALYEPDMTATIIMKETQLLLKNLEILKISHQPNNQVDYEFIDQTKNPKQVYKKCTEQYLNVKNVLLGATEKVKCILEEWKKDFKKQ